MELRRGMKTPAVGQLQQWLVVLGYSIQVDNDFGANTEGAVRSFQGSFNSKEGRSTLREDGIADDLTQQAIKTKVLLTGKVPVSSGSALSASAARTGKAVTAGAAAAPVGLIERMKTGFVAMPTWQKTAVVGGGLVAILGLIYAATTKKSASLSGFVDFLNGDEEAGPKTCSRTPSSDKLAEAEDILPEA